MPKKSKVLDYKELWKGKKSAMNESLLQIIEQELLNEVTYSKFKKDVKFRTKSEQLHKAIREVKKKLLTPSDIWLSAEELVKLGIADHIL